MTTCILRRNRLNMQRPCKKMVLAEPGKLGGRFNWGIGRKTRAEPSQKAGEPPAGPGGGLGEEGAAIWLTSSPGNKMQEISQRQLKLNTPGRWNVGPDIF